jgi:hypothetical protein
MSGRPIPLLAGTELATITTTLRLSGSDAVTL